MSEVPEAIAGAIDELIDALGTLPATIDQDGEEHAVSLAVTARRRTPDGGSSDREELFALLPAADLSFAPRADARVTLGEEAWVVVSAQPVAPGGEVIAWRLALRTWDSRSQEV
ncbi:MAG: hypothetical protein KIT58_03105 [Planctomycetota bacterium]|nr:hypothetical protein [Planctomycetota bacterium]